MPTGRLDGKMSVKEEALTLPSPAFPVEQSRESFIEKGLDSDDMVALLGNYSIIYSELIKKEKSIPITLIQSNPMKSAPLIIKLDPRESFQSFKKVLIQLESPPRLTVSN